MSVTGGEIFFRCRAEKVGDRYFVELSAGTLFQSRQAGTLILSEDEWFRLKLLLAGGDEMHGFNIGANVVIYDRS